MNRLAKVYVGLFWVFSLLALAAFMLGAFDVISCGREVFVVSTVLAIVSAFCFIQTSGIVLRR